MNGYLKEKTRSWKMTGETPLIKGLKDYKKENLNEIGTHWSKGYDFKEKLTKVLLCSDERVMNAQGEFKIGVAGQLILTGAKDQKKFIKELKGEIKHIKSHNGCGAANFAFKLLTQKRKKEIIKEAKDLGFNELKYLKEKTISQADKLGASFTYTLAQKIHARYSHLSFGKMRGEKEFHDARLVFFSQNKFFDPFKLLNKEVPPYFLSNGLAFGLSEKYCFGELEILSSIALGDHGFGDYFKPQTPFYVIIVGNRKSEATRLNKTAKEKLKKFGSRIKYKYIYPIS